MHCCLDTSIIRNIIICECSTKDFIINHEDDNKNQAAMNKNYVYFVKTDVVVRAR